MDYLGQSGEKALVNDRGRVLRVPFTGDGSPPEPGTRVNPKRDSNCCPSGVERQPRPGLENPNENPRRTVTGKESKQSFNFACDTFVSLLTARVKDLDQKLLIYPADTFFLPIPAVWLLYDPKTGKFSFQEFKGVRKLYTWCSSTFGTAGESQSSLERQFSPFISGIPDIGSADVILKKLLKPTGRPESLKTQFYIYDVGGNETNSISRLRYSWVEKFSKAHPQSEMHIMYVNGPRKGFKDLDTMHKEWFKNPSDTRFEYERLY